MKGFKWVVATAGLMLLTGCFGQRLSVYETRLPSLKLEQYFSGCVVGWGRISNWRGESVSRFKVTINGSQDDAASLVLDEHFLYDDGKRQQRIWRIQQSEPGVYVGTAADVVGEASGAVVGNALNWKYKLRTMVDGRELVLGLDDWLYLQPDGVLLNQTRLSKFGLSVGEVNISFQKQDSSAACQSLPEVEQWR